MRTDVSGHRPMTQVLVTRPALDAGPWITSLQNEGLEPVAFPLLELKQKLKPHEVPAVLAEIQSSHAVMFVSANAVRFLAQALEQRPEWVQSFNQNTRAWCTGPGTASALALAGIAVSQIDQPSENAQQLDSEALWQVVKGQVKPGIKILFVRGADETGAIAGRDWLAQQVASGGAQVQAIAAYQRQEIQLTPEQVAQVSRWIEQQVVWLFSSSACVQALTDQCGQADWANARAVVTHPRIAALAQQLGWRNTTIASPGMKAMLASIKSMA